MTTDHAFALSLQGYGLTTAEILYGMPDHPVILQTFVWQAYDVPPQFPRLVGFLTFWEKELDGPLYRVRIAHKQLITPREYRFLDGELVLH